MASIRSAEIQSEDAALRGDLSATDPNVHRPQELAVALPRGGDFLRFWTGSTVSAAGTAMTAVAIPIIAVQYLSATPAQMGVLFAAATASSLLVRLPAATWADRSAAPLSIVARGQLLSGVLITTLPLLWAVSLLSYESLLLVVAAVGATAAVVEAFAGPSIPLLVPRSEMATAYGRFTASRGAADVAGPAIGGMLLQVLAAPFLLVLDALSFFVAAVLTGSVRLHKRDGPTRALRDSLGPSDLWSVFRVPFLRRCLFVVLYASLANGAVSALLVLFMIRQLGFAPLAVGIVLGAGAVGGVLAGILIGVVHRRVGIGGAATLGGVLMIASLAGLPFAQPGWSGLAACLFYELAGSFGAGLMVITIVSQIPSRIAPTGAARAMAITNLVPELAATVGALAGGALASSTSIRDTLWAGLFLAVAGGLLTLVAARFCWSRMVSRQHSG